MPGKMKVIKNEVLYSDEQFIFQMSHNDGVTLKLIKLC